MTPWRLVQVGVVLLVAVVLTVQVLTRSGDDPAPPDATSGAVPAPPVETRVDVDTPELRADKAAAAVEACPPQGEGGASELPALTLACLGGGTDTVLSGVAGPAVVNLWASWCGPCATELPILARLHEQTGDRITVVGVDYQDPDPGAALDLLAETGATYPQLADPGGALADELKILGLPGTLFVDARGRVTFVNRAFDSDEELATLVREHTGVDPAAG